MAAASTSLHDRRGPSAKRSGNVGLGPLLALGMTLASRGVLAAVSMVVSAVTVLVLCMLAFALARRGGDAPTASVPVIASSALAWGGGFLHAVGVALSALRRDRDEGIRHLFVTRTTSLRGYLLARVGGLAVVLAAVVGGGTLVVSLVAIVAAAQAHVVSRTLLSSLGAVVYAIAFAAVISPIVFATLGPFARGAGYVRLLFVLVVPELLSTMVRGPVPREVTELCAIPSAIDALRSSIAPTGVDPLRFLRALVALGLFAGLALFYVRRSSTLLELERQDP